MDPGKTARAKFELGARSLGMVRCLIIPACINWGDWVTKLDTSIDMTCIMCLNSHKLIDSWTVRQSIARDNF